MIFVLHLFNGFSKNVLFEILDNLRWGISGLLCIFKAQFFQFIY